jgi:aryl-alcohol dehydrogenase-like predicted oxidoreductase
VLDAGINFIDTANGYGRSEEFIGKSISHRRSEYYLATKCGCYLDTHIWTRENVFRGLEESLRRLKTDHVDLMQLHGPTVAECEQGDFVGALEEMRDQGKTVWIGISTTLPDLPTYLEWGVFDTFQIPYSALERDHEDWITKAAAAGAGTIIRGGVSRGEPRGWLGNVERWRNYDAAGLDALRDQEESRTAFMLRFTLTHLGINTVIVGTLNPEHVRENVGAVLRGPLPPEVYAEAKRRLDGAGVRPRDSTS